MFSFGVICQQYLSIKLRISQNLFNFSRPLKLCDVNTSHALLEQVIYYHRQVGQPGKNSDAPHPGLTRVSSIRFLPFEIKRVLVYNSTIF